MQFRDDPSTNAKLDFLEQFHGDAARGRVRPLDEYARRFPELEGWLNDEYARLVAALEERAVASALSDRVVDVDEARLLAELAARRSDGGRYRRTAELGRGGTSHVFSVRDVELGRDLAMKVLRREGRRQLRRFLREARITARLEHPGVLPVHELGLDAHGEPFFTMRLVRGASLKSLFDELRPTAADARDRAEALRRRDVLRRRALTALLGVCDTMAFAHARGVIHRDLKPANVMLGDFGEVYVVDWGLARELGERDGEVRDVAERSLDAESFATLDGDVLGTPAYMPPEQAQGELARIGRAVDVYAVGAMLYQLLTGRAPYFDGESTPDSRTVLDRVLAGPPRDIAELALDTPPELVAIVRRAMAREPERRYPSCAELGADLRAFLERRIVLAHASGPWTRARKWVRRNPALAGACVLVLLAGAAGLVGWRRAKAKEADLALLATLRGPVELLLDFDALWPLDARREDALRDWLARAASLREKAPRLEALLETLRAEGKRLPLPQWLEEKEAADRDVRIARVRTTIQMTEGLLDGEERKRLDGAQNDALVQRYRVNLASLQRLKRIFEAREPTRMAWVFADPQDQLLHDRVDGFLAEFALACGRDRESAESRLVRAGLVALERESTLDASAWQRAWTDAIRRVAESPVYDRMTLARQTHLWPLGPDPESGLEEFAHVHSGRVPTRDAAQRLVLDSESALVLVLIPGVEKALIGSQSVVPEGPCYDPFARPEEGPLLGAPLQAYFIGKHELSRAQWSRLSGDPLGETRGVSGFEALDAALLPADCVSGRRAQLVMQAYGLTLPSSMRWEYAARGGAQSAWWTGPDSGSIAGAGNLADARFRAATRMTIADMLCVVEYDDGAFDAAQIGSYRANAFGLHDVIGNVDEWCQDRTRPRMNSLNPPENQLYPNPNGLQIVRGGSWQDSPLDARSAARRYFHPDFTDASIGLRAARNVEREEP
ncbi:MAG: bifunctional serine/threonine-protein kinase/formylglycine-generating enzyme family protein [Planctomycetes bacterium]|nr:bifunctional serine/threonine-protein kinase/formylglycine-generating enzyme family protein [Planctomycetota bacterium]